MIKILRGTFNKDEFVVDHEYKGHTLELVRKKQDIVESNICLLFDYYEKVLGIRDLPVINIEKLRD